MSNRFARSGYSSSLDNGGGSASPEADGDWKAIFLNAGWFAAVFVIMLFYLAFVFFSIAPDLSPWWLRLLLVFLPFLLFQGILHFMLLMAVFPGRRRGNIISATVMPFLLVAGFALLVAVNAYSAR